MLRDYMTFTTKQEARAAAEKMLGWGKPKIIQMTIPDKKGTDTVALWVIQVQDDKYLCRDGYVR